MSAPYLHDGRAPTLTLLHHDGEGTPSREAFVALAAEEQAALLAFLGSLQPPMTPSPAGWPQARGRSVR